MRAASYAVLYDVHDVITTVVEDAGAILAQSTVFGKYFVTHG